MTAISNPTNSTAVEEIINSERILRMLQDVNRDIPVYAELGWLIDASQAESATLALPQWVSAAVALSEGAGKTETDEYAYVAQTTTQSTLSASTVGIRKGISAEASQDTIINLTAGSVQQSIAEMRDQIDEDFLSNITDATNTSDYSGSKLTVSRFGTALAAFLSLKAKGRICAVLHIDQLNDLKESIRNNTGAVFGGALGNQAVGLLDANAFRRGYVDTYEGVDFYVSSNVPQNDADDWEGAIMIGGQMGAIALGMWQGIETQLDMVYERKTLQAITDARYGSTMTKADLIQSIISVKAA